MNNSLIASGATKRMLFATIVALSSTITISSATTAATLKVSIENLGPTNGSLLITPWVAFHNGSFDTFDEGAPASSGIKHVAEDAAPGLADTIPGFLDGLEELDIDLDSVIPPNETISSSFASSSAAKSGGTQSLVFPDPLVVLPPPAPVIFPGQTATKTIKLNGNVAEQRYFSYAINVFPSNDAFIGNDAPIEVFDAKGKFIGADFIVLGDQVYDAGTEANDEDPSNVPFDFTKLNQGVNENGTIQLHSGLKPPGAGGVLDFAFPGGVKPFTNADFKAPGYQVARITVTPVPEPATNTLGLITFGGFLLMLNRIRRPRSAK